MFQPQVHSEMELIPPVVTTHWLHKQLSEGAGGNLVVLDTTWYSAKNAMNDFREQHIMGAVFFDPFFGTKQSPLHPRPLPDAQTFEIMARGATVCNDSHVIVCEGCPDKYGFFVGSRVYMMFKLFGHNRVSVLDGGLEKWRADGYEITNMSMKKKAGDFTAKLVDRWMVKYEDMVDNLTTQKYQVLDSRLSNLYQGNPDDPTSGHYPCAVNVPFSTLFDEQSREIKKVEELHKVFSGAGVQLNKPIVTMCSSGMSSCSLALALQLCGAPDVVIYFGGFSEWKGKVDTSRIQQG